MLKGLIKLILIILSAGVFAVFSDQVLWPYFVERPLFYRYNLEQNPIYVTEKEETTIQENEALKDTIEKVAKTVATTKSTTAKGTIFEEPGLILTSDGLVVMLSSLLPANSTTEISIEEEKVPFQILKRDNKLNLALVKVEKTNLPTASFYPLENLKLGERIFLLGRLPDKKFVNEGIVRSYNTETIETNIIDLPEAAGSPVFDIEGNIVGLSLVAKDGKISIIPISKVKTFSGL